VIHELSYGILRLADGRRKERFRSYLQNLLSSGLPVLEPPPFSRTVFRELLLH